MTNKEISETFQKRLLYVLSLSKAGRYRNKDFAFLKKTLRKHGHWKDLPRGAPDPANFLGKHPSCSPEGEDTQF